MDALLRRELDSIARDRISGASELFLRAATSLQRWVARHPSPSEPELLLAARRLLTAQPCMTPILRLANEVALACDAKSPGVALSRSIGALLNKAITAQRKIADAFSRDIQPRAKKRPWIVVTYSYSSTVVRALVQARKHLLTVCCSEGRPRFEGRKTARALARARIPVNLMTDAALLCQLGILPPDCVIVGADALGPEHIVNKIGTSVLASRAHARGIPIWVLADTSKLWGEPVSPAQAAKLGGTSPVWRGAPKGASTLDIEFDATPYLPNMRILTECGWMTPLEVRRQIAKLPVSAKLSRAGRQKN